MTGPARPIVVGRLRRPHGLKGDIAVFPLTDEPAVVFASGRELWVIDLRGDVTAGAVEIERSRSYHREWLLKLKGRDRREDVEGLQQQFLAASEDALTPPAEGEVYVHELPGFSVRQEDDEPLGLVSGVFELPSGLMLEVQGSKREFLLPYRKEFVVAVDRPNRRLTVRVPEGLLDLGGSGEAD